MAGTSHGIYLKRRLTILGVCAVSAIVNARSYCGLTYFDAIQSCNVTCFGTGVSSDCPPDRPFCFPDLACSPPLDPTMNGNFPVDESQILPHNSLATTSQHSTVESNVFSPLSTPMENSTEGESANDPSAPAASEPTGISGPVASDNNPPSPETEQHVSCDHPTTKALEHAMPMVASVRMGLYGLKDFQTAHVAAWQKHTREYFQNFYNDAFRSGDSTRDAISQVSTSFQVTGISPSSGGRRLQGRRRIDGNPAFQFTFQQTTAYSSSDPNLNLEDVIEYPFSTPDMRDGYVEFLKWVNPELFGNLGYVSSVFLPVSLETDSPPDRVSTLWNSFFCGKRDAFPSCNAPSCATGSCSGDDDICYYVPGCGGEAPTPVGPYSPPSSESSQNPPAPSVAITPESSPSIPSNESEPASASASEPSASNNNTEKKVSKSHLPQPISSNSSPSRPTPSQQSPSTPSQNRPEPAEPNSPPYQSTPSNQSAPSPMEMNNKPSIKPPEANNSVKSPSQTQVPPQPVPSTDESSSSVSPQDPLPFIKSPYGPIEVTDLKITLFGVTLIQSEHIFEWQYLTALFIETFYNSGGYSSDVIQNSVFDVATSIEATELEYGFPQGRNLSGLRRLAEGNTVITYKQATKFDTLDTNMLPIDTIIIHPFSTDEYRSEYMQFLKSSAPVLFKDLHGVHFNREPNKIQRKPSQDYQSQLDYSSVDSKSHASMFRTGTVASPDRTTSVGFDSSRTRTIHQISDWIRYDADNVPNFSSPMRSISHSLSAITVFSLWTFLSSAW